MAVQSEELKKFRKRLASRHSSKNVEGGGIMKNRSEKKRLDGNSFLLAVTIILLFFVMYIAGIIMFGGRGFAKVQNFLNLFISNAAVRLWWQPA